MRVAPSILYGVAGARYNAWTPTAEPTPEPNVCAHDLCKTGAALSPSCDPCAASIADVDPYCEENSWDDYCVEQVASVCGRTIRS